MEDPTQGVPSSAWHNNLHNRTPARGPLYMPEVPKNRGRPQAREPAKCLNGRSCSSVEKQEPKRPSCRQLQEARNKLWWGHNSCGGGSLCPCMLGAASGPRAKHQCHLHTPLSLGQICHRQEESCVYAWRVTSVVSYSLRPCRLWPVRLLCWGREFSRQENRSVLANSGCHTLLDHFFPCCPSSQPPWVPGASNTPATQENAPPPTWPSQAKPKSSREATEAKPSGWPTCRGGNKITIETQRWCG